MGEKVVHAEKIHRSCDATTSRMTVYPLACPLYCPRHANGNPLASLIDNSQAVSSTLGSLR
jgi:hypothetical protein